MGKLATARGRVHDEISVFKQRGSASKSGVALPPLALRTGGAHFQDNTRFVESARLEASRLVDDAELTQGSYVVELGCGAGRLATGLLEEVGPTLRYLGVDVRRPAISWCSRHISRPFPTYRFQAVNARNERYNPSGQASDRLPAEDGSVDCSYSYSVFSHMLSTDVEKYLREFRRIAKPGGYSVSTAFVEVDVPDEEENPPGYGPLTWEGPLHCVRFNRSFLEELVGKAGFSVVDFTYGEETDGQSRYVLRAT